MFEDKDYNENFEWVVIFTTNTEIDALMYKANLESADIPVQVLSQVDTTRNFTLGDLAIVKILVPKEFADDALNIINSINSQSDE